MIKQGMALFSALALGFGLSLSPVAAADPDDAITYRENIMESVGANMTALALIAQGKVPHQAAFAAHAEMLAKSAALATDAFRENTAGKGKAKTTAKADVWSKWPEFEKGLQTLEAQTAELSRLAAAGDIAAATAKIPDLGKNCKACHDDFRSK